MCQGSEIFDCIMDRGEGLHRLIESTGRRIPEGFGIEALWTSLLLDFDKAVREQQQTPINTVLVDRRKDPSVALPMELQMNVFRFLGRNDSAKLRLTCRGMAHAGMAQMLAGRGGQPLHLHFGINDQDLTLLCSLLSNNEIASRIGEISLSCAHFDRHDLNPTVCDMRGLFHKDDDLHHMGDHVWSGVRNPREEIRLVNGLGDVLSQVKRVNRERRLETNKKNKKPGILLHYGATFDPAKWETLARGLRRMVRIDKLRGRRAMAHAGKIYAEQGRFLDWALYVFWRVVNTSTIAWTINGDIQVDFVLLGRKYTMEGMSCAAILKQWKNFVGQHDIRPGEAGYYDWLYTMDRAAKAKSDLLAGRLSGSMITGMMAKDEYFAKLIKSVTWLHIPPMELESPSVLEQYSIGYSRMMLDLYQAGATSLFRIGSISPSKAQSWRPISNLPTRHLKNLELLNFVLPKIETISHMNAMCRGFESLKIHRALLYSGEFGSVLDVLGQCIGNDNDRVPRTLVVDQIYQKRGMTQKYHKGGPETYYIGFIYDKDRYKPEPGEVSGAVFTLLGHASLAINVDPADDMVPTGCAMVVFPRNDPVFLRDGVEGIKSGKDDGTYH